MKKKKFFTCMVFCFTVLFLTLPAISTSLAGDFTFDSEFGFYDPTCSPSPTTPVCPPDLDPQGFNGPAGMDIDPSGIIYVADSSNHRVLKYDSDGNFDSTLTACPDLILADQKHCSDPGEIKGPVDVAVDPTGQYVYVVTGHWDVISKFESDGDFVKSWGFAPVQNDVVTDFMREPAGVAVDDAGDVYVTDVWASVIWKFDSEGDLLDMWTHPYASGDDFRPAGISLGRRGVYITDYLNSAVHRFAYNGNLRDSWGGYDGTAIGEFTYPAALDVDADDNIFVADSLNNRIQAINDSWTAHDGGVAEGTLDRPFGITADDSGNIYVADTFHHRILKYTFTP